MKKQDEYIVSTFNFKKRYLASSSSSEHESNANATLPRYDGRCFTKAIKIKTTYPYPPARSLGYDLVTFAITDQQK